LLPFSWLISGTTAIKHRITGQKRKTTNKNRKKICCKNVVEIVSLKKISTVMATVNYFVSAKKRKIAPVYIRVSAGRGTDLIGKSGLFVNPAEWSNKTQTIKQRIRSKEDDEFVLKLKELKESIENDVKVRGKELTREWLTGVIFRYHNKKDADAKTLNQYIEKFLTEAEEGKVKNRDGRNIAPGTARTLRGFQLVFNEYQGVYTDKRREKLLKENKTLRPQKLIDFEDVTIDFYNSFTNFLTDEGYKLNTQGRFIKQLKYFMSKSLREKKHSNREFKEQAFIGITENSFAIYLTPEEIEKIYRHDLSSDKRMEVARDKFIVLCETALRVSDYDKIDINIRVIEKKPFIALYQTKTADPVIIPLTRRMDEILNKYDGRLPKIHDVYVNKFIKTVAQWAGINETIRWETTVYGKRFPKSAPKWKMITCHTGRRSAATNMYKAEIKPIDIMRITGHRTEASFLRYIRQSNEEVALRLSKHDYFIGNPLSIAK
jgi:integrase